MLISNPNVSLFLGGVCMRRSVPNVKPIVTLGSGLVCPRGNGWSKRGLRFGTQALTTTSRRRCDQSLSSPCTSCITFHRNPIRFISSEPNRGGGWGRMPRHGNRLSAGLGILGTMGVLAGKGKYLLGALKLTKFASLGSMIFTVGTYSMFFGLPYATGMVGLILIHESGHALVMKKLGIPFSPMVFIPFMGAAVAMKDMPKDAYQEALIAFGGPYLGTAGAVSVAVAARMTDSQLLYALADFGFMINLFNMLPIGMMDGGRICGALSPYAGVAGLGVGGMMIYNDMIHNPIFYLVMLGGAWSTFERFYYPNNITPNYYNITAVQRSAITAGYFGLVAFLFAAMAVNARRKKPPEVLQRERQNAELTFVHY